MSVDRPAVSPAISESGLSHSSRNKRWSGGGFISSSGGGGGLNVSSELADFEDIDLGGHDPGDGDSKPRMKRHHSELTGLGIRRSRSPNDANPGGESSSNSSKFWRKTSPKRNSIVGLAPESPKSSGGESSRPSSKRGLTALNLESISNGNPSNMRKLSHHRRTSSELERVYDSDDSVPPETVFHNVPLSPSKIPQLRKFEKVKGPLNDDDGRPATVREEVVTSPEEMPSQLSTTNPSARPSSGIFPRRVVSYHEAMTALDDESQRITRELSKIPVPMAKGDDRKSDESNAAYLSGHPAVSIFSLLSTRHCPLALRIPSARTASLIAG